MTLAGATEFETPCGATAVVDAGFRMLEIAAWGNDPGAIEMLARTLALPPPLHPGRATGNDLMQLFPAAPRRWWLRSDHDVTPLPDIDGLAVTEMSDGQVCVRLHGDTARDWLAQYCPMDLRPRSFGTGQVAWTLFSELRVLLHCVDSNAFDMYLGSSFAEDIIAHCLTARTRTRT
ncbi:MAG: hypothetical protein WD078_07670 [Woeseia sp.]